MRNHELSVFFRERNGGGFLYQPVWKAGTEKI